MERVHMFIKTYACKETHSDYQRYKGKWTQITEGLEFKCLL